MPTKAQLEQMYREWQKLRPIIKDRQVLPVRLPRMIGTAGGIKVIKAPANGIPARDGIDPGSVECDVLNLNATDELIDSGDNLTVFNFVTVAVLTEGERIGLAAKEIDVERWWAIADDCKDTAGEA